MFAALKERTAQLARSKHAEAGIFVLAFAESSFFPIPPDVALGPMAASHPDKWARFAFFCAAGSVLGAILGYAIGLFLGDTVGKWILHIFLLDGAFERFRQNSQAVMPWVILGQGLIPVPYKLVTIASGMLRVPLWILIACSVVTRTTRFFTVAFLFKKYGPQAMTIIEKQRAWALGLGAGLAVVAAGVIYFATR